MILFDDIIKNYTVGHIETCDHGEAITAFIKEKCDIMSYYGSINLKPGDTILYIFDFLTDFQCDPSICYVVDGIEFSFRPDTRLLVFLTPLHCITLRNRSEFNQIITFNRWAIKPIHIPSLKKQVIKEGEHIYHDSVITIHNELYQSDPKNE